MKIIKKILFWLSVLIVLINFAIVFSGYSYVYKTLYYQYADIDDYTIFENRTVATGTYIPIPEASLYNKIKLSQELKDYLLETQTTAFLVLKNDSVYYEEYWDGYDKDAISNSFSVSKSIVSILIGIAIDEGRIKSVDQKVSDFIPEYANGPNAQLTIRHLLTMSAGFDWDESYNSLFSPTTKAYYGSDLKKIMFDLKVIETPGVHFNYQSCNQLVLAYIIEKSCGKNLSEYASEKLWKPLGAKHDALWSLDRKGGFEKAYCCFNSNARDFSRIGTLVLHNGMFNGKRIVSEEYLKQSETPSNLIDEEGQRAHYYGYSWWLTHVGVQDVIYAQGISGQFIIVIPGSNTVIVRLGKVNMPKNGISAAEYLAQSITEEF
jgi:CubicO group peptidase (beta-lactamase class C family)